MIASFQAYSSAAPPIPEKRSTFSTIIVTDALGAPIVGASVVANKIQVGLTNVSGTCMVDLRRLPLTLQVTHPGFRSANQVISRHRDRPLRIVLYPLA